MRLFYQHLAVRYTKNPMMVGALSVFLTRVLLLHLGQHLGVERMNEYMNKHVNHMVIA